MKLSDRSRFPHPVLWSESGDYIRGRFQVDFEGQESLTTGAVTLKYAATLEESAINDLLARGAAAPGVFVSCMETYYDRLLPMTLPSGKLEIAAGLLKGRVILRPVIWSTTAVSINHPDSIHPEFGNGAIQFAKGSMLAIGDEAVIEVGREKLARIESIFSLARNDEVPANQFALSLDNDKVEIWAAQATYEKIYRLRATGVSQAILLNSVYLPAVMDVLACLQGAADPFEGKRWHRIVTAKLRHLEINVDAEDLLVAAQRLLSSPFSAIPEELDIRTT